MGERMQLLKGKANETMGKAKVKASKRKGSDSTGSEGVRQQAKGKTQPAVGNARRIAKKATR